MTSNREGDAASQAATPQAEAEVRRAACCVVGGGPGGAVLALLLARRKVPVVLLEAHDDFDRDFRGDTVHPSVLELMDELGLSERLHQLPHAKIHDFSFMTSDGPVTLADFRRLDTRYPYIMMIPQATFLAFLVEEAKRYPEFQLTMGARVEALIEKGGAVRGVRYEKGGRGYEVHAPLTVGADGRSSRLRHLGGFAQVKTSPPMDVLWFRVPRRADDPDGAQARFGGGQILVLLNRGDQWQVAYVIPKGGFREVRARGIEALGRKFAELLPQYADRVEVLKEWKQVSMLSVESSRVKQWYKPGLLLIGDAAHVMSPVGGVGINYAIQDAVVAANVLAAPLRAGTLKTEDLAEVQRRREWPTRVIQAVQARVQQRIIAAALDPTRPFTPPLFLRLLLSIPGLRDLPARTIAFGIRRVHFEQEEGGKR